MMDDTLNAFADIDKLIHEPARLMLMAYLYVVASADFLFLMRETGLTRGNLAGHMNKLEAAGYIEVEKTFVNKKPQTLYHLTAAGRQAFQTYRTQMQAALRNLPE